MRPGKAQVLTIYLGESDQWQGQPLYVAILQLLRQEGCAGATALRAVAGYGASARLHGEQGLRWSSDATIVIQVIDQPARLGRLLPRLSQMLQGGLITLQETEVLFYTPTPPELPSHRTVRQVMATLLTTVGPETAVAQVVELLLQAPFRALPVVDEQRRLLGIVTTGDLIRSGVLPLRRGLVRLALALDEATAEQIRAPLTEAQQGTRSVAEIMNRHVCTVHPEQSLREAARLMVETGLRRLPVVDRERRLVGMLSRTDLLRAMARGPLGDSDEEGAQARLSSYSSGRVVPAEASVLDYMRREVVAVHEETALAEVLDALLQSPLKRVVVVDDEQHVQGIISDVDVLAGLQEELRPRFLSWLAGLARDRSQRGPGGAFQPQAGRARRARDVMNRNVVTVRAAATVSETVALMMRSGRKVLPVVDDDGRLVGIVGRSDLLRVLLEDGDDAS
uniref:CBS domain-containing protein n=1 Tax=Thermogemmatispora argillosa TaxID=2045280 RepID=A0A455SZ66_9CHLR|nr:hypothetical protein KTA_11690 [Thermogemmatispora argillosa]